MKNSSKYESNPLRNMVSTAFFSKRKFVELKQRLRVSGDNPARKALGIKFEVLRKGKRLGIGKTQVRKQLGRSLSEAHGMLGQVAKSRCPEVHRGVWRAWTSTKPLSALREVREAIAPMHRHC